ncbi:MAG: hypothetical protein ACT4OZ_13125 [Gemmatimonadota bacterium]
MLNAPGSMPASAWFLRGLNEQQKFFEELLALEHPRFIMQYRRKRLPEFLDRYESTLRRTLRKGNRQHD